ncbi:hypothetical protein HanRHA438_Chr17g0803301 [Helianthus annuus]|uniref:Uncharacterized protein n=1 Tax=Helianthus annuus TaxID=4232 RepID=A0A251RSF0_HELAN|nr:hypothetical protein HanHA300_Chr17g0646411 [Helianthus annuus]KAJ0432555.1 hypothetical protein HanIR_Chr17g0860511 [Helianthus annuus]KAJ0446804.1 hypothetical protein HanHA89_Chr17g0698311 [Helianthus annuus]KAJ0631698.1 hypothetical protein HanLR1_Chr17g0656861 [Helianthus annuus]KAJ0825447.1 hypothetical protein HanRHA438_Chr17g0803301 [Helianthus annuus]
MNELFASSDFQSSANLICNLRFYFLSSIGCCKMNKENYVAAFGDDIPSSVFLLNLKEKFMCCKHTDRMQSLMKIFM